MENFLLVFERVLILFLMMGVGFVSRKTKFLSDHAIKGMVDLLLIVVTPAVIIDVFSRDFDPTMLKGLGVAALLTVGFHLAAMLLAVLVIRRAHPETDPVLKLAIVFSNSGFMGIPMQRAILGDEGVFYGAVYIAIFNLFIWTWGFRRMQRKRFQAWQRAARQIALNPGMIGLTLGLIVFMMPWKFPEVIKSPVHSLSDLNTPLAMIVIGYYLAGANLRFALSRFRTNLAMAMRLIVTPLLLLAAIYPLKGSVDYNMLMALVIASCAPTAATVSMFAAKFKRDIDTSVALVSASTAISIITMPIIIAFALNILAKL